MFNTNYILILNYILKNYIITKQSSCNGMVKTIQNYTTRMQETKKNTKPMSIDWLLVSFLPTLEGLLTFSSFSIVLFQHALACQDPKQYRFTCHSQLQNLDVLLVATHCVKSVRIRSYSGSYFPAFELNTPYLSVFSPNAGKYGPDNSEYRQFSRSDVVEGQ